MFLYEDNECPCSGSNLDKMIQPSILSLLYKEDLYGLELIAKLGEKPMFRGSVPDKAGVYRYLKKMEASGKITSVEVNNPGERTKNIYSITPEGKICLINWIQVLNNYQYNLSLLLDDMRGMLK